MVVSLVFILPFGMSSVPLWDASVLAKGAAVAILSSVLPYSLELLALRSLSQQVFGILLSLEPVIASLAGWALLGQAMSALGGLGVVLVVVASAGATAAAGRERTQGEARPSPEHLMSSTG